MLTKISGIKDVEDFNEVGRALISVGQRRILYRQVVNAGLVLSSDEMMTPEQLEEATVKTQSLDATIRRVSKQEDNVKVLHLLQLLAHCHPGITRHLNSFLSRTCV